MRIHIHLRPSGYTGGKSEAFDLDAEPDDTMAALVSRGNGEKGGDGGVGDTLKTEKPGICLKQSTPASSPHFAPRRR
jgi:hypothetical protein